MPRRIYKPAFPLAQYVEQIWRATDPVPPLAAPPSQQRVYPDGAMALVIHLRQPAIAFSFDGAVHTIRVPLLAGPYSRPFSFDLSQSPGTIGIVFRPGAARVFFPVAAHELHNVDIPLSELHPGEADRLLNELCTAADERSEFGVVERYLMRKLRSAAPIHPAVSYGVDQLSRAGGMRSVRRIQSETGLSHTRFIQLFREHVGMTPKLFCRVRRFHGLLNRVEQGVSMNWAELAADCGYFDQAHLIRDFRAFAGVTPLVYRRLTNVAETASFAHAAAR